MVLRRRFARQSSALMTIISLFVPVSHNYLLTSAKRFNVYLHNTHCPVYQKRKPPLVSPFHHDKVNIAMRSRPLHASREGPITRWLPLDSHAILLPRLRDFTFDTCAIRIKVLIWKVKIIFLGNGNNNQNFIKREWRSYIKLNLVGWLLLQVT